MKQEVVKQQNLKGQRDVLHICNNLDCPLPPLSLTAIRESRSGFEKTVSIPLTTIQNKVTLFWMSQRIACVSAWLILYHGTIGC